MESEMPWTEHPSCERPEDDSQLLWRYMDIWKFVDMLQNKSLYFPKLENLDDPWEGYLTTATVAALRAALEDPDATDVVRWNVPRILAMFQDARLRLLVSCWHMSDQESAAMWKLYTASDQGICIKTTYAEFGASFTESDNQVMGSVVNYVDYGVDQFPWNNMVNAAAHKRLPYRAEAEFRAIYLNPGTEVDGLRVNVDLTRMIQEVVLAPGLPEWSRLVVERLLQSASLDVSVRPSELDAERPY